MVSQPRPRTIGRTAFAVQSHHPEDAVAEDREARDVAAVFEEAEHQEERRDHRQHNRDGVGDAHRDQPVLPDQEVADDGERNEPIDEKCRRRIDALAEHSVLEQPDERLRAEHTDEEIEGVQHGGENREARGRPARRACECLLDISQ
jgi:hypothetical protein